MLSPANRLRRLSGFYAWSSSSTLCRLNISRSSSIPMAFGKPGLNMEETPFGSLDFLMGLDSGL